MPEQRGPKVHNGFVTPDVDQQLRVYKTLASIIDFAYAFDPQGRFLYANQPLLDLLGLTLDEIVGKTFFELPYPPDLADRPATTNTSSTPSSIATAGSKSSPAPPARSPTAKSTKIPTAASPPSSTPPTTLSSARTSPASSQVGTPPPKESSAIPRKKWWAPPSCA